MFYEILCLISSKTEEKDIPLIAEKIDEIIKNLKGGVTYKKNLGEKKLSYPIKHEKRGFYLTAYFEISPQEIKNLEEKLKNIPEILRYQIIKIKEAKIKEEKSREVKPEKISKDKIDEILEKY